MRIYVVNFNGTERLVEANAPSQAVMHVASGVISAKVAKAADVERLMAAGSKVEAIKEVENGGA